MALLAQARLRVAENISAVGRDELLQEFCVAVVQHQVLIAANGTRISRGDPVLADALLTGFAWRIHALVVAPENIRYIIRSCLA